MDMAFAFLLLFGVMLKVNGDIYLHNPRGSNNRLDENNNNRNNGNRMFDSQNNVRGGYNVGDATKDKAGNKEERQFHETFFMSGQNHRASNNGRESTYLPISWTNQHGCGADSGPTKNVNTHCNIVIQYMCRPDDEDEELRLRDGTSTQTNEFDKGNPNDDTERESKYKDRLRKVRDDRGLHESFDNYDKCQRRERNRGLFTADQNLNKKTAISTRQNPNADRYGFECPEERDYYPYWHPSEWRDIAVLGENKELCDNLYAKESFNVKTKWECMEKFKGSNKYRPWSKYNNEDDCVDNDGEWLEFTNYLERAPKYTSKSQCEAASNPAAPHVWARPMGQVELECLVALPPLDCKLSEWSRDNHLGNGMSGEALQYNWELPYFPSGQKQRCVVRLRYNVSTNDFPPHDTDYKDGNTKNRDDSIIENNPDVRVADNLKLQLAINTAQYGRTFQDRSHYFTLNDRPANAQTKRIYNLNVRGKRGNIVQVYPAVEYDFIPTNMNIQSDDLVHVQWAGSNSNDNNNDGEGKQGTDRSNIVQIQDRNLNYPMKLDDASMFAGAKVYWAGVGRREGGKDVEDMTSMDIAVQMATSGYTACASGCSRRLSRKKVDDLLNNAPASFPGMLMQLKKGKYEYMCSRNNNFSNRSQKATMQVN